MRGESSNSGVPGAWCSTRSATGPAFAREDDAGDAHADAGGEELDVRLVLDLLAPGQQERSGCVLAGEEPPGPGDQLGVGLVAAERGRRAAVPVRSWPRKIARPTGWSRSGTTPSVPPRHAPAPSARRPRSGARWGCRRRSAPRRRHPSPASTAPSRSVGNARSTYIASSAMAKTSTSPTRRIGRDRYGDATTTIATTTARRTVGNRGASVRSTVLANRLPERRVVGEEREHPSDDPARCPGDDEVARQPPAAHEDRADRQQADRPDGQDLVAEDDERAPVVRAGPRPRPRSPARAGPGRAYRTSTATARPRARPARGRRGVGGSVPRRAVGPAGPAAGPATSPTVAQAGCLLFGLVDLVRVLLVLVLTPLLERIAPAATQRIATMKKIPNP